MALPPLEERPKSAKSFKHEDGTWGQREVPLDDVAMQDYLDREAKAAIPDYKKLRRAAYELEIDPLINEAIAEDLIEGRRDAILALAPIRAAIKLKYPRT